MAQHSHFAFLKLMSEFSFNSPFLRRVFNSSESRANVMVFPVPAPFGHVGKDFRLSRKSLKD